MNLMENSNVLPLEESHVFNLINFASRNTWNKARKYV